MARPRRPTPLFIIAMTTLLLAAGVALWLGLRLPDIPVYCRASDLQELEQLSPDDLFLVQVNGLDGYIDRSDALQITPQFHHAGHFSEGLAYASRDGKYGYIDTQGDWVIEPVYSLAGHFSRGLAPVRDPAGLYGYIRPDGTWAITPRFESAQSFGADGRALVGSISLKGRLLERIDTSTGDDWTYWWIDTAGRRVARCSDPSEPSVEQGGLGRKWQGGLAGFADHTGAFVIPPMFAEAGEFSEGLAPARAPGGKWGCIDAAGNWIIEPKWDWTREPRNGLCEVTLEQANGYVDRQGNVVWAPPTWTHTK